MSALDGRTAPDPGPITPDPDCLERPCRVCGAPVVLAWAGRTGRTLRPVTVDAGLGGDVLTPHKCGAAAL